MRLDDEGYSYVFQQPTTPEEESAWPGGDGKECPVEAIGLDGDG